MLMRLVWPITDPLVGFKELIDTAVVDYPLVLDRLGYVATGLPRDWEIQTIRRQPGRAARDELTCVVEVQALEAREVA